MLTNVIAQALNRRDYISIDRIRLQRWVQT
jgi:hypothetical protein